MRLLIASAVALATFAAAAPAFAADEPTPAFKLSGSFALLSDYRLRGVSQTNNGFTYQGGATLTHSSGLYASFFASNLAGWGTFGGPNLELDAIGGYKTAIGPATLDVGITWYNYPGGATLTSYVEPYVKLSGSAGPVSLTAAIAYAPAQKALGNWSNNINSRIGDKEDNIYVWGDAAFGIPSTPVTLKAHLGYSDGNPGLGPNGTSIAPTGKYFDWLLGADWVIGPVTLGVAYVDTDISKTSPEYLALQPNFSKFQIPGGKPISDGKVLVSLTAAF